MNSTKLHENLEVVALFTRANWMPFIEKLHGYDDEATEEFIFSITPHSKTHPIVSFKGLTIEIAPEFTSRIASPPLGLP